MILQALAKQYEALAEQGKLDKPGWARAKISFALCINDQGELEQVDITKIQLPQDAKKATSIPRAMSLPAPVKRTVGISSNFLWDNSTYLLGVDNKSKPQRSLDCFNACKALHHDLLDGVDSPAAKALLAFFDNWAPKKAADHPALREDWEELISGANLVFRHNGAFVHDDPLVRETWQSHYDAETEGPQAVCLVTGCIGPAEAVHPAIKGVVGAQSSGAALVSFNAPAFCSYGKEQNLNAPVSKQAVFAYTAALNYMIADRDHVLRIGDTTVLFWARDGKTAYQDFLLGTMMDGIGSYSAAKVKYKLQKIIKNF